MSDRFLEELKDRTDLVALVGRYAQVKKTGKNYSCKSPFRNEKTPSFSISPDRGLWYDFGASEGGDALRFLEKIESLSFSEAVEMLAGINNMTIPDGFGQSQNPQKKEQKQGLVALHKAAVSFFQDQLKTEKTAMEYLQNRGMTAKTIENWGIGFGGNSADGLTQHLIKNGFKPHQIKQSGVAYTREYGGDGMKDRFTERIITPVFEPKNGDPIAFSARIMPGSTLKGKYINSPENPLYVKSKTLFGLHAARRSIITKDLAVVAEGNFDVISAHQAGCDWVIATCGTALTEDHIRILRRMTKRIALAFDTDMAGKKATLRAAELLLKSGLTPYIISIESGKDLDELAQKDPTELKKVLIEPINGLEYFCKQFYAKAKNAGLEGEKAYFRNLFYYVRLSSSPIEIDEIITKAAQLTSRPKAVVEREYAQYNAKTPLPKARFIAPTNKTMPSPEQKIVGEMSLHWGSAIELADAILPLLEDEKAQQILSAMMAENVIEEQKIMLTSWEMMVPDATEKNVVEGLHQWIQRMTAAKERAASSAAALAQFQQKQDNTQE